MTNVGQLFFRILANYKHDGGVADRALAPNGLTKVPSKYAWAKLGETISGRQPDLRPQTGTTITDPSRRWVKNAYAGRTVYVKGKNATGVESARGQPSRSKATP